MSIHKTRLLLIKAGKCGNLIQFLKQYLVTYIYFSLFKKLYYHVIEHHVLSELRR